MIIVDSGACLSVIALQFILLIFLYQYMRDGGHVEHILRFGGMYPPPNIYFYY